MPFQPFTPEPEHHHELVVRQPITTSAQLRTDPRSDPPKGWVTPTKANKPLLPRWAWWVLGLAAFISMWWMSMPFRGLAMLIGVFWFFAFGAHPASHIGRTAHNILDGDDND